jgi:uncharacterized protein (DUF2062 family)
MADAQVPPAPELGAWRRRLVAPIVAQLRQGLSPGRAALALALGFALGLFPVLGSTTLLCAITGAWLRLNQPLIQLVNYLVFPLQLALIIPFVRAGERLFGAAPVPLAEVPALVARFEADPGRFLLDYAAVGGYGIVAWAIAAPPLAALVYAGLRPVLARLARSSRPGPSGGP